jgi:outer membrane biosynthesis protein TonB
MFKTKAPAPKTAVKKSAPAKKAPAKKAPAKKVAAKKAPVRKAGDDEVRRERRRSRRRGARDDAMARATTRLNGKNIRGARRAGTARRAAGGETGRRWMRGRGRYPGDMV